MKNFKEINRTFTVKKNSILGKARWLRDVALATSKNNGARVAREWLKFAAMFVILLTLSIGNAWGQALTLPFNETFAGCNSTGGNDNSWSGTIASGSLTNSQTDNDGWTFGGTYSGASACAKFGANKNQGTTTHSAQTPLLAKASSVTLTFKAGSWDGDETSITVATTSGTITPATGGANPFTASNASFTTYTFTITGITADFKITISSYGNKERFFLDDVSVVSAAPAVKRTVTWMVNGALYTTGGPTTEVNDGSKVTTLPTAPNPASYCGAKFMGWTTTDIGSTGLDRTSDAAAITALGLFSDAEYAPTVSGGNVTYYAVFADEE